MMDAANPDKTAPSDDTTAEPTGSDLYRRMPEGASLGGPQTEHVAETLEPGDGMPDWGVDADSD
jgi:hypothetical protein